jgi:hypothetical protein
VWSPYRAAESFPDDKTGSETCCPCHGNIPYSAKIFNCLFLNAQRVYLIVYTDRCSWWFFSHGKIQSTWITQNTQQIWNEPRDTVPSLWTARPSDRPWNFPTQELLGEGEVPLPRTATPGDQQGFPTHRESQATCSLAHWMSFSSILECMSPSLRV